MPKPSEPIPETSEPENENIEETGSPEIPVATSDVSAKYASNPALAEFAEYSRKQVKTISDKQEDISKEFQRQEDRVRKVEDKLDENRTQLIETLGLFVALFTFISVEFSLFKAINVFSAVVSLTLIVAGLLIFFVLLLHVILKTGENMGSFILYISLVILIVGLIFFGINFNNFYSKGDYFIITPTPILTATSSATLTPIIIH